MRAGGCGDRVAGRAARARAEQLWRETVARPCAPTNGSNVSHLPLSPSPGGGGGTQTASASSASPLPSVPAARKLRALWNSAFHLGLTRDRSDGALVAWLRRQKSLDAETCPSADALAHAIQPLEAWLTRAGGVDWRPHLSLGRCGQVREVRRPRARVLEAQWRLLYRQRRVRIASHAALGAYAARFAGLGRTDSHLALDDAQADALIRHLGKCIRAARGTEAAPSRAASRA